MKFDPKLKWQNYLMSYRARAFEKRYYDPASLRLHKISMKPGKLTEEERLALPKIREYVVKMGKYRKNLVKRSMKENRYIGE